jgi:dTDP-4-amino-4,6-dideoxygalactose transaminase
MFSFHPRKSLTTGEGGMIVTNDSQLVGRLRRLRNHGRDENRRLEEAGFNYRMTEMQAALGCVQLRRFPAILSLRRKLAAVYLRCLEGVPSLTLPESSEEHTWQTFMVVPGNSYDRDSIVTGLLSRGIEAGIGSLNTQSLPAFNKLSCAAQMPVSDSLYRQGIALPLHSKMTEDDVRYCAESLIQLL